MHRPSHAPEPLDHTDSLRSVSRLLVIAALSLGGFAMLAWPLGVGDVLTFGPDQVPMAPGTGLLTVLIAMALWSRTADSPERRNSTAIGALLGAAIVFAAMFAWARFTGHDLAAERWLAGTTDTAANVPLGRVSQYTALLLAALALTLLLRPDGRARQLQAIALTFLVAVAIVFLQGYILGAPLLYGTSVIPVAAPTATVFFLLSVAAILQTDVRTWPMRTFLPSTELGAAPARTGFIWLAITLSAVVISSGYFWFLGEGRRAEQRVASTLANLVDLKSSEVAAWKEGYRTTAATLLRSPMRASTLRSAALAPDSAAEHAGLTRWMRSVINSSDLESMELYTTQGQRLMRVTVDQSVYAHTWLARRVRELPLRADSVIIDPLRFEDGAGHLVLWVPMSDDLLASTPRTDVYVALVVRADARLYPMLGELPVEFDTGEFLLWQLEGDSLRIVSQPPNAPSAPFRVATATSDTAVVVTNLLRTGPGSYTGRDYLGAPVRVALRGIAGTPWVLAAKVNLEEIAAPVRRAALRATVVTLLVLLGVAALIYVLWYRRDLSRAQRELALVAERQRVLEDVQRSEERYARALRGTSDGIWEVDLASQRVFVSDRCREILGLPVGSTVEKPADIGRLFDQSDWARAQEAISAHIEGSKTLDVELRLLTDEASPRWIRARGDASRDAEGRPLVLSGAVTDITAERLADAALQRSQRVLAIRSAANLAIVRAGSERELLQAICDIAVREGHYRMAWIGYKEHDPDRSVRPMAVAGENHGYVEQNAVTWGEGPRGQGPTGRTIRSGAPQVAQNLLSDRQFAPWRAAAAERGFQSSLSIPLEVGGDVIGALMLYSTEASAFDADELALLVELGRDVSFGITTLRGHVTLQGQREQLALFRQAIERSSDAIFVADVQSGRFVDFNDAALRQLGYTAEEMRAVGPAQVVLDMNPRGGIQAVAESVRHAGGVVRPSRHRRKDGSEVPVEVALTTLDLGGRTLILGIARDISDRLKAHDEREELEQQLNRSQKMESVGRLAGGVAHDFNNLLTVINTTTDLALGEVEPDSALHRDLVEIRGAGKRAAALTRQLLAFSRQQVLRREVLALNEVVSGFLKLVSRIIGEDIHLELRLGGDVPPILADAGQLEQVLMNLCVNARDAMPGGGTLTIGTGSTIVDDDHAARREGMLPGPYAVLSITDTGIGMDAATQAKIFEPFFTTKELGKGTGLGLSTVYGIVKQSGGSVWVYSEVGQGTTFRIYLPATDVASTDAASAPAPVVASGGTETILLVEDEDSIRLVARRVLEKSGYTVLEANSGTEALERLAERDTTPDLVMTDLVMPGMTGIELADVLRRTHPKLKVLFTSGYSADVVSDRFHPSGDWNFISKPYGVAELAAEVRRVLDA